MTNYCYLLKQGIFIVYRIGSKGKVLFDIAQIDAAIQNSVSPARSITSLGSKSFSK